MINFKAAWANIEAMAEAIANLKNVINNKIYDILQYAKTITQYDEYFELTTPDGQREEACAAVFEYVEIFYNKQ